jgi:hypothetical protein
VDYDLPVSLFAGPVASRQIEPAHRRAAAGSRFSREHALANLVWIDAGRDCRYCRRPSFLLGPYLLWSFLSKALPTIPAMHIVGCIAITYGSARLSHTGPSDYVLELPYGGGLNFASRRPNPIFDTMLFNMQIPPEYQRKDLERIEQGGPALIVAQDAPRLGTNFSFGIPGNRTCVCPRLVWIPDQPSWDPNYVYPLVDYIARNYHPAARIGGKVILERNRSFLAAP